MILKLLVQMSKVYGVALSFEVDGFREGFEVLEVVFLGEGFGLGEHLGNELFLFEEGLEHSLLLHFDFLEITFL